jgi:DNA polymerase elongation subunit (family B)
MEFPRKEHKPLNSQKDSIEFQITDIYDPESDKVNLQKDATDLYSLLIYGTSAAGATYCVNVKNFIPYFYIKPPEKWESLNKNAFKAKVDELNEIMLNDSYKCFYKNNGVMNEYNKKIISRPLESHFVSIKVVRKKDFWGFTNDKIFRFLKVSVKSLKLYNNLKYYFKSLEKNDFKMYETNIDPFLKYIHTQNIRPCDWVRIEKGNYDIGDDISRCDYNIETEYKNIAPSQVNKIAPLLITSFDIECSSSHGDFPVAKKNYSKVAQDLATIAKLGYKYTPENLVEWLKTIYVDDVILDVAKDVKINRVYAKHKITASYISSIQQKIAPHIQKIIDILNIIAASIKKDKGGDDDDDCNGGDGDGGDGDDCDGGDGDDADTDIKGGKMTVRELNAHELKLTDILTNTLMPLEGDKIIQIGTTVHIYGSDNIVYKNIISLNSCDNIDGCDVEYYDTEKEVLLKWKELMNNLNSDIITGYNIFGFDMEYIWQRATELNILESFSVGFGRLITRKASLVELKLSSSALGDNILRYIDIDGTVLIDLLKVMQRDQKLDSYKLDNVASIFLGDKKDDLKPQEIFDKFKGNSEDRCVIARYCIQDCCLCNRLIHKLKILENNIGMGNVCLVPLNFLFRRGQGIKIFSLIAKECMEREYLIPTIKSYRENIEEMDDSGYEGAVVLEPKEGIYLNEPIVVFDYGSLYPSSMISCNLSHDCYLMDEKYRVEDPNIEYKTISYDLYEGVGDKKKKTGEKDCVFVQYKDGRKGIIADVLDMLLKQRKNTRKKIEYQTITAHDGKIYSGVCADKGDHYEVYNIDANSRAVVPKGSVKDIKDTYDIFAQDVLDALQLAYKVTANSLYGQIGARTSSIYLKEIAACTTATGRNMIMLAKDFVERNYDAEVIYGDTDSIFCKFPLTDKNGTAVYGKEALQYAIDIGKDVEKHINVPDIMPNPQKLNYEKCLYPFILFSKKRYVGNLYETDTAKYKQKSMGIVLKRRDNAQIVKKIYGGIINIILEKQDLDGSIVFLQEELKNLVEGKTPIKELVITKSLKGAYKDPTKIAHKVLADRIGARDPGNRPVVNERIPFVYIKTAAGKASSLQGDRIEHPEYIEQNNLVPDYLHYITNQIMKPILQLYALCLDKLPGYDKCDEYWDDVDRALQEKPLYQVEIKRRNRINNLKLMMAKELLFDYFINILTEPKAPRAKVSRAGAGAGAGARAGATVRKSKLAIMADSEESAKPTKSAKPVKPKATATKEPKADDNEDSDASTLPHNLEATIKITNKIKTKTIESIAFIKEDNSKKKKLWEKINDNCRNKDYEIIELVKEIVAYNSNSIYCITLNKKDFINEYNRANYVYNDLVKTKRIYTEDTIENIMNKVMDTQDTGRLADLNNIRKYYELIQLNSKFIFMPP